jgi:hypothetical protein
MTTVTTEHFTLDELLTALTGATLTDAPDAPDAATADELAAATGRSLVAMRRALRRAIDAGRVECIRRPYTRIDGARVTVPAYRVRKAVEFDGDSQL